MLVRALNLTDKGTATFNDVKSDAWYADSVAISVKAGIVKGQSSTTFGAAAQISREEMVTMLMRGYEFVNGKQSNGTATVFKDQSKISTWAAGFVKEATALGLINGRGEGTFQPQGVSTRAEAAQVIYNLLQK